MSLDRLQIQNNFSKSSLYYDQNTNVQKASSELMVLDSLKYSDLDKNSNILDLGSGTGNIFKLIQDYDSFANFVNCDLSLEMIKSCIPRPSSFCANITKLPIAHKESFSHIYSSFCLQWLEKGDFKGLFDILYKICKSGALLSFSIPVKGSFVEFLDANTQSDCNFNFIDFQNRDFFEKTSTDSNFEMLEMRVDTHKIKYLNLVFEVYC